VESFFSSFKRWFGEYVSSDEFGIKDITKQLSVIVRFDMRVFIEKQRAKTPLFKAVIQPDTPKGC